MVRIEDLPSGSGSGSEYLENGSSSSTSTLPPSKSSDCIGPGPICKVEFIQPSNWLYSVPNLLVIQHLVTLYLGGFDVRVVSEIE